ncbi:hypothetical protein HK097_009982 [Rhizophlyctis rosea]|uniref:Ribosomal protein L2 C-terminal domain-containing protein n=1 Tax=Rhizophlyctis rosea TaxID=64517 RepID=A0AAD5SBE9_9FUNG|nr:hypothetical protein HK097_009982 [Rhizophlyctis rosea]
MTGQTRLVDAACRSSHGLGWQRCWGSDTSLAAAAGLRSGPSHFTRSLSSRPRLTTSNSPITSLFSRNTIISRTASPAFPAPVVSKTLTRTKTYVKKPSRNMQRLFKIYARKGETPPKVEWPVMENAFYKVVGGMKVYKGVTPGTRNRRYPTRFHLHKGMSVWRLSTGKNSTGGRCRYTGKITVRGRGGGHKKRVRFVDFNRSTPGPHEVVRLEYDPNRSGELALLRSLSTNELSYIIRPADLNPGDIVESYRRGIPEPKEGEDPIPTYKLIQNGNCLRLKNIPVGTQICCIGLRPDGPAQLARAAGTSGQLLYTAEKGFAQVRMASKEVRLLPVEAIATIGKVGNELHHLRNWGKAGSRRHKGFRPKVRGIAKNAFEHPHGGKASIKGDTHPKSPWGWLTKGYKTVRRKKWYIVTPKWKAKQQ